MTMQQSEINEDGILSLTKLSFEIGLLFFDCFETELIDYKGDPAKVLFTAKVDRAGKIVLEVSNCPNVNPQQEFKLECHGKSTNKLLTCKRAMLHYSLPQSNDDYHQESCITIKPLTSVILTGKVKGYNSRVIRAYMTGIDRCVVFSKLSDTERHLSSQSTLKNDVDNLGRLFVTEEFTSSHYSNQSVAVNICDQSDRSSDRKRKKLSDDAWRKETIDFLNRLADVIGFAQGGRVSYPVWEVIIGGKVETEFSNVYMSSQSKFMPVIKRQADADKLVGCLISRRGIDRKIWEQVRRAIIFSLSVQQFNEIGLFSKLAAIEVMCKICLGVGKEVRGFADTIHKFMKIDEAKKLSLFPEFSGGKKTIKNLLLVNIRNDLCHDCTFNDSNEELVKQMADVYDIWTRLVLSFFGFEGLYCRYDMDERSNGMTEIKNGQVLPVDDNRLDEFEREKGSRMSAINFRLNYNSWRVAANTFIFS